MADVHECMIDAGWSDGFPLVPPTKERVGAMLSATVRAADDVLGEIPPMYSAVTVGLTAANAVMAGCEPKHFRIVLAGVTAMLTDEFNLHGVHATTMGATPAMIVSGPARVDAGLNSAHGALGSGSRANACIGRALKLVLQNVGGAKLGGTESTTIGSPSKFSLCVAEAEEVLLDGWLPYHASSRSFNAGDSAVTVLACTTGPTQLVDFATREALPLLRYLGSHLAVSYAAHLPLVNEALLVVSPEHMATLHRGGVTSKSKLALCLFHTANRASSRHLVSTLLVAMDGQAPRLALIAIGATLTLLAVGLSLLADCLALLMPTRALDFLPLHSIVADHLIKAPKFTSPASLNIVVAGAGAGKFSSCCAGFGVGRPPRSTAKLSVASSAPVEPPSGLLLAQPAAAAAGEHRIVAAERARGLDTITLGESFLLVDPRGFRGPQSKIEPIKRPASLSGGATDGAPLTIGLLDISKAGGSVMLDELQRRLVAQFPNLRCARYRKPTFSRPMPPTLAREMAKQCHVAVAALAD